MRTVTLKDLAELVITACTRSQLAVSGGSGSGSENGSGRGSGARGGGGGGGGRN